jgi:hypothetical protein
LAYDAAISMWTNYLEHLSDRDLALLARIAGRSSGEDILAAARADAHFLDRLLWEPSLFEMLFGSGAEVFSRASPFLTFAVLTHRGARDLARLRFVEEWVGPGRRVPSFAVEDLRAFLEDDARRLYLVGLLASFTRVASGSFWVQSARGWKRKRFSDLDPMRMVELLEALPEPDRPPVYQRLGDLTLFLTGVFPDYAAGRLLPGNQRRLLRHLHLSEDRMDSGRPREPSREMSLLETVGSRSYRLALEGMHDPRSAQVLGDLTQRFDQARRLLDFLTHRYLFPYRDRWYSLT